MRVVIWSSSFLQLDTCMEEYAAIDAPATLRNDVNTLCNKATPYA